MLSWRIVPEEYLSWFERFIEKHTEYTRIGVRVKGWNDEITYEKRSWDRTVGRASS